MPSDTNKPVRAAKAAALKNAVWLPPASTPVKQKRRRSPDAPSAPVKQKRHRSTNELPASPSTSLGAGAVKARTVGKTRTSKPKPKPAAQGQAKASRVQHIPMDVVDSDEDGLNNDGEDIDPGQTKGGSVTASDGENLSDKEQEDIKTLDSRAVRVRFAEEVVDWGTPDAGSEVEDGIVPENPQVSSSQDEDEEPITVKPTSKRAANRLAEVPQWEERPADAVSTCTDSGTPLSSGEEEDAKINKETKVSTVRYSVNKCWPIECHYVPSGAGQSLISLRKQPKTLRAVIRAAINKTIDDLVFDNAYPPIDGLASYFRATLIQSARNQNLTAYAKQSQQDAEFTRVFGRVLTSRMTKFRGELKRAAAKTVEGHYHLLGGRFNAETIKGLLRLSHYIYPTKKVPDGQDPYDYAKPFFHPAIITILRETLFVNIRGGTIAARNQMRFKSSVAARPMEYEIPESILALVATSIHSALEDHGNGIIRKTDFNADMYEDVYRNHLIYLSHIQAKSVTKYHHLMAGIYNEASNVFMPRAASINNEAILQLDLDGMEE